MIQEGPYKNIKRNLLSKMIKEVTNVINSSKLIIEEMFKFFIKVSNSEVPKIYALLKLHKQGKNIRPIFSNINEPIYHFAKHLVQIFPSSKKFESHLVKNNINLVKQLFGHTIQNNNRFIG